MGEQAQPTKMTRDVLESTTAALLGGDVAGFDLDRLRHLITLTQHATNILVNELERRDELTWDAGFLILPYLSDHVEPTVLTRDAYP